MSESVCPHCGGSGWKIIERDGSSGAERCVCRGVDRANALEDRAGIPPLYRASTFDNFKAHDSREALASAVSDARKYASSYLPNVGKPGLLLVGGSGTGKTHLAVASLRKLLSRGFEGIFFDYHQLLEAIRTSYDVRSGAGDRAAYRAALDAEILLLDDIGTHRVTDWVMDTITAIITERCNNRKAIIATTNLAEPALGDATAVRDPNIKAKYDLMPTLSERIGERARSRLFEMCYVVRMPAVEDYRMQKPVKVR
jgi:DNA replication protein DnaC